MPDELIERLIDPLSFGRIWFNLTTGFQSVLNMLTQEFNLGEPSVLSGIDCFR